MASTPSVVSGSAGSAGSEGLVLPARIGIRELLVIAWPIIGSMFSFTLMNFVNALWVGPLGQNAVAGVGFGSVMLYAVHGFGMGVLSGLKISVAQATGARDERTARRLAWQGLHLGLWLGLGEMALITIGDPLFGLFGSGEGEVHQVAVDYFAGRAAGAVPAFIMLALTQYLQGRGRTVAPMVAMIIANVANVGLDPLFIYGGGPVPAMGAAGAGWAGSVAYTIGAAFLVVWCRRELASIPERAAARVLIARVWRLGMPLGMRMTLEISSYLVFQGILMHIGAPHLAAHFIVVRTISVSFLPGYALSEAVAVLVGQAVGAKRFDLVADIRRVGLLVAIGFMSVCGLVFLLFPEALAGLHHANAEVTAIAVHLFIIGAAFQIFDAYAMVGIGFLNGAGDTRFVMIVGVAAGWAIKVPLGWALAGPAGMGAAGAWIGILVEIAVVGALVEWRMRRGHWRRSAAKASEVVPAEETATAFG